MLRYAVILLPKENRDMLEVLVGFLRQVAAQAGGGESGNRMDVSNLAVVFAPNILYAKPSSKDKDTKAAMVDRTAVAKDESLVAIEVVKQIIEHQDCLWQVGSSCSLLQLQACINKHELV